jgi:bifunctional non-homologous end joining protein LigD
LGPALPAYSHGRAETASGAFRARWRDGRPRPDRASDFGALHSGRHNERAQLYAFDMLAGDGEDHRQLPLSLRKINLARLLRRRIPGIFIAEYEQGDIGRDLFRVACNMELEGIVSKRRDGAYVAGKCRHWAKNPAHPAYSRVRDQPLFTRSRKSRAKP